MRDSRLDVVFAIGVFLAAVAIAARYGVAAVMAWLGFIAALVAGLNVLLRARHPRNETFVTSKASGVLRRQSTMTVATVIVWVVALAACGAYGYRWWKLRDSKSPLDVTFARLEGRTIDYLLEPPRAFAASAPINGQEVVFTATDAYRTLVDLRSRFSVESTHTEFYFGRSGEQGRRYFEVPEGQRGQMFVGSSGAGEDNHLNPFVQRDATAADVQSLGDPSAGWVALARDASSEGVAGSQLLFRRPLRREDLAASDSPLARFWQHITKDVWPTNFGWVDLTADAICADENARVVKTIVGPLMSVEAAYYVNDEPRPQRLGLIVFRESASAALRTFAGDRRAISEGRKRILDFDGFPLRPAKALVIPLRLVLTFPNPDKFDAESEHVATLRDASDRVRSSRALQFGQFTLDGASLALSPHRTFDSGATFVYGASARLEKVVIDDDAHRVRSVPGELPFASSGSPIGSCPYFAAFDGQQWRAGGVILRGRADATSSGTDERPLRGFAGRVRIEEREREITILDRLYVVAVDAFGRETLLASRDPRLQAAADGRSVRLERGDVLDVEFAPPPPATRSFRLGATGYYTPLHQTPAPSSPRPQ